MEASQGYPATYNHIVMNIHISLEPQAPWPAFLLGPVTWRYQCSLGAPP